MYLGASPSKKSVSRLRQKVGDVLVPHNVAPWTEVRDRLNSILRGWSNYFGYGTRLVAYRAVDQYVYERVRNFLRHRHHHSIITATRLLVKTRVAGKRTVTREYETSAGSDKAALTAAIAYMKGASSCGLRYVFWSSE